MRKIEQPRTIPELMARMKASQDAIAMHHKAMQDVAANAAASNQARTQNGGDSK